MARVLLVEDEGAFREDIADYLRLQSFDVDEAASGSEALMHLQECHYDVVLCDIMMPQMDGYDVLLRHRASPAALDTPFIFLTALTDAYDQAHARKLGCDDFLAKPVDFNVLLAAVNARIAQAQHHVAALDGMKSQQTSLLQSVYTQELLQPAVQLIEAMHYIESIEADQAAPTPNLTVALAQCKALAHQQIDAVEMLRHGEQVVRASEETFRAFTLNAQWLRDVSLAINQKKNNYSLVTENHCTYRHAVHTEPAALLRCIYFLLRTLAQVHKTSDMVLSLHDDAAHSYVVLRAGGTVSKLTDFSQHADLSAYRQLLTTSFTKMHGLGAMYVADTLMQRCRGKFLVHHERGRVHNVVLQWPALTTS